MRHSLEVNASLMHCRESFFNEIAVWHEHSEPFQETTDTSDSCSVLGWHTWCKQPLFVNFEAFVSPATLE